ncbi:MAG: LysM peptidoglycan-binding domain-containing protein [Anaerotignaceae bacterium]
MKDEKIEKIKTLELDNEEGGYFSKEKIANLARKKNGITNPNNPNEIKEVETRKDMDPIKEIQHKDIQREYTIFSEKEEIVNAVKNERNNNKEDFNNTKSKNIEKPEENVQLVRQTRSQSAYTKGFSPSITDEMEEIERTLRKEKTPKPKPKKREKPKRNERTQKSEIFENSQTKETASKKAEEFVEINHEQNSLMLDNFFAENLEYDNTYNEEDSKYNIKNIIFFGSIALIVVLLFMAIRTLTVTGKLHEANEKLEVFEELQQKNEELKIGILTLEEENAQLKEIIPEETTETTQTTEETEETQAPVALESGEFDTYTVVDGDSFWTIAQKTLGNGVYYQKILDANGLTEDTPIKPGQTLKIPK